MDTVQVLPEEGIIVDDPHFYDWFDDQAEDGYEPITRRDKFEAWLRFGIADVEYGTIVLLAVIVGVTLGIATNEWLL